MAGPVILSTYVAQKPTVISLTWRSLERR